MGYILPISDHQSQNYATRELKKKSKPFFVFALEKINSSTEAPFDEQLYYGEFANSGEPSDFVRKKVKVDEDLIESTISEMTGIGRHFNKSV